MHRCLFPLVVPVAAAEPADATAADSPTAGLQIAGETLSFKQG